MLGRGRTQRKPGTNSECLLFLLLGGLGMRFPPSWAFRLESFEEEVRHALL